MILQRFYDEALAQASWMVGCAATGEALVVDPNRDVEAYLDAAEAEGLRITHVTETHIHADFVSGARELASRTGARLHLSDEGGPEWTYAFAAGDGAVMLKDGDWFKVGHVRIDVLHTPGHTPEHLSFAVTDTAATERPMGVFTGDFVFVGDVGRPDLLERAAGYRGTMERSARLLFRSLQRFKERLPDYVQIWPGHGAGSACGKALGAVPQSTLGYEKLVNWGLAETDEEAFVRAVLAGQPEPPKYFARMKRINREGPRVLGGFPRPPHLEKDRLAAVVERGATVVDLRSAGEYAVAHVPGTVNVPLNRSFNTWAGWLLPYDRDVYLIVPEPAAESVDRAVRELSMVGLDRVAGWFTARALEAWRATGRETGSIAQITSRELAGRMRMGTVTVLDVRGRAEWEAGHLPGVENVPVGYLADRFEEIPRGRPLVVHCQGGARSAIAASVLQALGIRDVLNLTGGYREWVADGNPVERGEGAAPPALAAA
ncbi:MAG TPA: rhodanese-like domain-containing protein [Longimicrobium sp.]|nr:rhodanese-like domain-containing protein [Longimicrobium sp.]